METVDHAKLTSLMVMWVEHENWIQAGCPKSQQHRIRFPGYETLAEQDVRGYDAYRHALVPYFAEAQGFPGVHDALLQLAQDAEAKYPVLWEELIAQYSDPDDRFRAQWGNLFGSVFNDGLSHQTLLDYQRKFEVELPLCFLAQLRELVTNGTFKKSLDRFRDRSGNFKKGLIAQYVIDGLGDYPEAQQIAQLGYRPKLRNAIGHNTYVLADSEFRALDQDIVLTRREFSRCFSALQTLQNAVMWFLMGRHTQCSNLDTQGIVAIGWAVGNESEDHYPQLLVYQLAPFHRFDMECAWLCEVIVRVERNLLVTELSNSRPIRGEYVPELRGVLELIEASGHLQCIVSPIMPCVHDHEVISLLDGNYCEVLNKQEVLVPARVVT